MNWNSHNFIKEHKFHNVHKGTKKQIETSDSTSTALCTKVQRKQCSKVYYWKFLVLLGKKKKFFYSIMLYGGQKFPVCLKGKLVWEFLPKRLALGWESWNIHQVWPTVTLRHWINDIKYKEIFKLLNMSGNPTSPYI